MVLLLIVDKAERDDEEERGTRNVERFYYNYLASYAHTLYATDMASRWWCRDQVACLNIRRRRAVEIR